MGQITEHNLSVLSCWCTMCLHLKSAINRTIREIHVGTQVKITLWSGWFSHRVMKIRAFFFNGYNLASRKKRIKWFSQGSTVIVNILFLCLAMPHIWHRHTGCSQHFVQAENSQQLQPSWIAVGLSKQTTSFPCSDPSSPSRRPDKPTVKQ